MIRAVIGIAMGLFVLAFVMPMALVDLADVNQTTTYEDYTEVLGTGDGLFDELDGYFDHVPDDGTITVSWTTGAAADSATGTADELTVVSGSAAYELDFGAAIPDVGTTITATYDYTVDIGSANHTLLTVLLPIVAVIGIIMFFVKKD